MHCLFQGILMSTAWYGACAQSGENGRIIGVQFLETPGDYGFRESIEEALQQWVFEPATIDGIPVRQ